MIFNDYLKENEDNIIDIYFDMDGVFAEYQIGNFDYSKIRPIKSVIKVMNDLIDKGINVKVLSICKTNKIREDKYVWIDKYTPFLDRDNLILISKEEYPNFKSEELKSNYLKENVIKNHVNILIDDDSRIIWKVVDNNPDVKVFHVSSIIK